MTADGSTITDQECEWALAKINAAGPDSSLRACVKVIGCSWATLDAALTNRFSERYARAKEARNLQMAEEILAIADTPQLGERLKTDKDGNTEVVTGDMIDHRKLQVDSRKWLLSKLLPKQFGDKLDLNHGAQDSLESLVMRARKAGKPSE